MTQGEFGPIVQALVKRIRTLEAAIGQNTAGIYFVTGAPPAVTLGNNGEFAFRTDGAALTTIYQKRAGVWIGVV